MGGAIDGDGTGSERRAGADGGRAEPAKQGADSKRQLLGRKRLGQIVIGTEGESPDPVGLLPARREEDDTDIAGLLPPAELGEHVVTRHPREHQVEDHNNRALLPRGLQRSGSGGRGGRALATLGQMIGDECGDVRLVIHYQDAVAHDGLLARIMDLGSTGVWTLDRVWDRLRSAARSRSLLI